MRHAGTQEIETERLVLRRLTPEDAGMMYQNWANDPQVTKFLRWEPHKNADETRELLTAWALLYPNGDYYQWGIVEKATGQVFGSISVFTSSSAEPERDPWPGFDHANGVREVVYDHDSVYHKFDGTPVPCKCYALTREHYNILLRG